MNYIYKILLTFNFLDVFSYNFDKEGLENNSEKFVNNEDNKDEKNIVEDENNIENSDLNNKNDNIKGIFLNDNYFVNKKNYDYFKNSIINAQKITSDDFKELKELKEWLEYYKKQNKKTKKKLKDEYDIKNTRYKELNRKFERKIYIEMLFYNIIEKSEYFNNFLQNKPSLTVNELNALRIYDGKSENENSKSLVQILFNNKSDFINILNGFKIINHNPDVNITVHELSFLKDTKLDTFYDYYVEMSKVENGFLKLFTNNLAFKRFKLGDDPYNAYIDFNDPIIKKTNILNKKFRGLFLNFPLGGFLYFNALATLLGFAFTGYMGFTPDVFQYLYIGLLGLPDSAGHMMWNNPRGVDITFVIFGLLMYTCLGGEIYKIHRYFNPSRFYFRLCKKYYKIKKYIRLMKEIYIKIKSDEVLYENLKDKLINCEKLFNDNSDLTNEQKELLTLLERFPEDWSYWKHFFKIKTSAKKFCRLLLLFDKNKEIFINPIIEISNIGSIINVIRLLKDEKYQDKICIPDVSEDKDPILKSDDAWNPFLDPEIAVPNNIRLGKNIPDEVIIEDGKKINIKNGYSTGLLYGMNAGGKTTTIESVGLLNILSRSYGFCFAKNCILSNFARIFTVIDVTTDISKGYSRYMSELITVDDLLKTIKKLKSQDESMLILCDEVFAGTNPEAAGLLSTNVIRKIMNSDNVVSLIATHNIKPTELEKESSLLRNLNMRVDLSNNDVIHKYKIDVGLKKQSIAESIVKKLQKEGIIETGNDILGSPI